jgi:hypothetical protein
MSNKKRWHINFGDTSPQVSSETELWVSTSDDNILRYNGSSWVSVGGGGGASSNSPLIVSASPTNNIGNAGLQTIVNGLYFSEGANVKFIGTNNVEYSASQVTVVNTTKLIATQPALLVQYQPYDIKVINTDGSNYTIEDLLYVGNIPVWTTSNGNIGGTWSYGQFNSASVIATDADGHNISYQVTSGYSLPTGVSLNSNNGVISGTLTPVNNITYNFSIDAVDTVGNRSSRAFSIYATGSTQRVQWTTTGTTSWTSPITGNIKVLVVAGGGSGGYDVGGGGGAGGVIINNSFAVTSGTSYTVTVGAGGTSTGLFTGGGQTRNNGGNSVFSSLTAVGGGYGGNYYNEAGNSGGSGGGGQGATNGGEGTAGQGNKGGGYSFGSYEGSGAGGGAGAVGGNASSSGGKIFGGTGGIGIQSNITGVNTYYGGGGGGGGTGNLTGSSYITSLGGLGGGGKGFSREPSITVNSSNFPAIKAADMNGAPNTGGGGGGTGGQTGGGNGGSGIVAIEYSLV